MLAPAGVVVLKAPPRVFILVPVRVDGVDDVISSSSSRSIMMIMIMIMMMMMMVTTTTISLRGSTRLVGVSVRRRGARVRDDDATSRREVEHHHAN